MRRLLVAASVVPSSPILVTLMKEALGSSETSVLTRATWRNRRENLKSYIVKESLASSVVNGNKNTDNPMMLKSRTSSRI
jgi:hypothetical protein